MRTDSRADASSLETPSSARLRLAGGLALCLWGCQTAGPAAPFDDPDSPPNDEPPMEEETPPEELPPPSAPEHVDPVYPGVPPAISGGTLVLSADGERAVAADPDRDLVYVVNLANSGVARASFERGSEPGRVAIDAAGRAHVALRGAGAVASIDLANARVARQTDVCALPRGVAYQESTDALFVACASGELVSLSASDHRELLRVRLERDLRDVVFDGRGRMFVSLYRKAGLLEVSPEGDVLARHVPKETTRPNFSSTVFLLKDADPPAGEVPAPPISLRMQPALAWRTLLDASGSVVMLHQRAQVDEVLVGVSGYGFGGCDTIAQTGLTEIEGPGLGRPGMALASATLAVDASASPDGRWVAVAAPGELTLPQRFGAMPTDPSPGVLTPPPAGTSTTVRVFSTAVLGPDEGSSCGFPDSVFTPDPELLAGQATAVAFAPDGRLIAQSRQPAQLEIYAYREPTPEVFGGFALEQVVTLDPSSAQDLGHDLFHGNVGGGLACASCHGEGTDDGHVWTFSDFGARRTQNMRGGLLGTEPFHWAGDMQEFRQLVDDVMTKRMSGFVATTDDVENLLTWIDHLPALRAVLGHSEAAERGAALFESSEVGCATCHSGRKLTNNTSADVGTGEALQVPSLLGIAMRAPYMHDGCAATLRARFDDEACGGGDRHGHTSQLSDDQLADLVAYLETL